MPPSPPLGHTALLSFGGLPHIAYFLSRVTQSPEEWGDLPPPQNLSLAHPFQEPSLQPWGAATPPMS